MPKKKVIAKENEVEMDKRAETAGEKLDREFLIMCRMVQRCDGPTSIRDIPPNLLAMSRKPRNWSPFETAVRTMLKEGLNVDRLTSDREYREEMKLYLLSALLTPLRFRKAVRGILTPR
jgi:hypothetical protein